MKSRIWLVAAAMSVSSLALAQSGGVTENTDPAKIAAIEQHAQQLASGAPTTPMMDDMHKHHMGHHKHHKGMHKHAAKDKGAEDKPMANESKG